MGAAHRSRAQRKAGQSSNRCPRCRGSSLCPDRWDFPAHGGAGNLTHCIGSCASPNGGVLGFPYLNPNSTPLAVNQLCGTEFGCPASTSGGGYIDPAFQNPRVSSFTGGIEQALPYNMQLTATYSYVHSTHLRTGGYDSEEAWQRNYIIGGTDPQGRAILQGGTNYAGVVTGQTPCLQNFFSGSSPTPLDPTLSIDVTERSATNIVRSICTVGFYLMG